MAPRGGARERAGRPTGTIKPEKDKKHSHHIRFSDEEWKKVKEAAKEAGITAAEYVRRKVLRTEE
jgi:hypothetical protein